MKRKSWFYRQLLSYMPAFFIVVSFIFFVFFQMLSDQSRKEATKANETLLLQAVTSIDSSMKTIEQMLLSNMLNNPDLSVFFNDGKQSDYYLNIKVVQFMKNFQITYPLVDSMYLVRMNDEFILSNSTSANLLDYPDYELIKPYLAESVYETKWTGVRTFQEFNFKEPEQVISLVLKAPYIRSGEGFVIVNIQTDALNMMIQSIYSKDVSYIDVMDGEGKPILPNDHADTTQRNRISSATSPLTGWSYESGLVHGGWVNIANQLYNVWFIVGLVMTGAGVWWIVFVARRNYRPIEQIVSQIQKFSQDKTNVLLKEKRQDEFTFIQSALNNMLEQSNSYQQQYREDLLLRKTYLFQQLLDGQYPSSLAQWETQRETIPLNDLSQPQTVCVIKIDKFNQFVGQYTQQDQYLMKFALRSVIQETAQKHGVTVWTEWISSSKLGVLVQISDVNLAEEELLLVLENSRVWVEEHLKLTITAGVGRTVEVFTAISESYTEALQALKYKMIMGENTIIFYTSIRTEEQGKSFDYFQQIQAMTQSFRLVRDDWREQYKSILKNIEKDMLNQDHIISLTDYMIYSLGREMNKMAKEFQEYWNQVGEPALNEALMNSDTLVQMESQVEQVLEQIFEKLLLLHENRNHSEIIRSVRAYMEKESANQNMSLDFLSGQFQMNPKSLSKLFKEETGQKFVDYLIELRMNHARHLLEDTHHSIQEIAEEVGYTNAISFGRVFKKVVSMSPGEYREQASEKNA
ncbi:helix-turn-helix domain-containing protein [Paenibacillus sp. LHD-38]|uniref:helix-turn-helix domain-containing protein n=1 Tax=Paenibacillus sp. LHD-38 TaxID=3072143 RepID=UPI00280D43D0|nr:helix-turn-helix domain-containing protein [Paenibacillus sp. LHD-38]MDQ8738014.1 helix-turn-helix domain-containing protein [Paenibacillus sp. LHD-38]